MKKINFIIAITLTISGLLSSSCKKEFLDQKPTSTLNEPDYFTSVQELETGLVGIYGAIRYNFDGDCWTIGDVGSDDADCGSLSTDQPQLYDISYSRQNAANGWALGPWMDYYMIIGRCNEIIDRSLEIESDSAKVEKIADQAKFIRALMYYHLVTEFGDVPLVTKFLNPDQINLERASTSEVWSQIETDLIDATNLPAKLMWNESGRVTSGAAYSLLGKVYLTQKKYDLANSAFYKVVQSGQYSLVSDFGYIFRHDGENCGESVFEIQHKNGVSGGDMGTWAAMFRLPRDHEGEWGFGFDCPTSDLLNEFEPGDPRAIYTFIFPGDEFPGPDGQTYVYNAYSPTGYNSRKAWLPFSERANMDWQSYDYNCRYMRYAEVLLLYAESLNEMNKPDSAVLLVNMVRERARNTPASDPQRISCNYDLSYTGELLPPVKKMNRSDLRNAIWHEQRVELAIEGQRRHSLLRTGRFKERMETAKAYAGVTVEPYEVLLPVPETEIVLSNNVLTQNPGY